MRQRLYYFKQWAMDNRIFVITCCLGLILYLLISISKHLHFGSTGFDLVIFDQAVRQYSEFVAPASSFRGYENLLGDHFHPILVFLAPLYWLFNSPINLLVAQAVLIISACLPIYLYTKNRLGILPAIFLNIVFILNPALLRAIYFDFHEIAFAIPLIAWGIYFMDRKRWMWFYASIALLLLVKEDLSILVAFFGIYLLFSKQYKRGLLIFTTGIVWFLLATKLFIPYFAGENGSFNYWSYDRLGSDLPSSIISIVSHPFYALSLLFIPIVKTITLIKTFGIFLGTTFFSPLILLAIPLILERFLSSSENYWQFNYHYGATLAPILVMAAADSLYRVGLLKRFKKVNMSFFVKIVCANLATIAIVLFIISPMNFIFQPNNYLLTNDEMSGYAIIDQLPGNTSICTTNHIAPHIGKYDLTLIGFNASIPSWKCDYILTSNQLDQSRLLNAVLVNARASGYSPVANDGSWVLYKK